MLRPIIAAVLVALPLFAQQPKAAPVWPRPYSIQPDYANIPYGPYERNVLDLWQAKSRTATPLLIYIHGGGFVQGDKSSIAPVLLRYCLDHGISVATINYRYSTIAPYPAPMLDGARAVQFLRSKAREWNFEPHAFAAAGNSAGAGISLWVGFHDDMAEPDSPDPVKRQSTRLTVIGTTDGQSTYDPRLIAKLIDENTARISALVTLYGLKPGERPDERIFKLYDDAAPINHLKAGAPPVFMYYTRPLRPLPAADQQEGIHNPRLGYLLKERMDKLGIECQVHLVDEYKAKNPEQTFYPQMVDFSLKYFPKPK